MPRLHLTSMIAAPAEVVFDLNRHVGLHQLSMQRYGEEAVAGIRSGLMGYQQTVTWKAKHLGRVRFLTVTISAFEAARRLEVTMTKGDFHYFQQQFFCKPVQNGTLLIEDLYVEYPYGWLGRLFGRLYLNRYLCRLLEERHACIKDYAESNKGKDLLRQ